MSTKIKVTCKAYDPTQSEFTFVYQEGDAPEETRYMSDIHLSRIENKPVVQLPLYEVAAYCLHKLHFSHSDSQAIVGKSFEL